MGGVWLPMVVTHPTTPSDFALHFIRVSPDFSSFFGHSRTSTISPTFSFRVVSLSFRVASFDESPSSSKDSVRMVSFMTFQRLPPSSRKTEPWLPATETHPSTSSFIALAWTRMTCTVSSSIGPSRISRISPASKRRRFVPSRMVAPDVMTVSLATFMKTRTRVENLSLLTASSSSQRHVKSLSRSAVEGAVASSFFSHVSKKARNSALSIESSFLLSIASKTAVFESFFVVWWYLIMATAAFSIFSSSWLSFFFASSLHLEARFTDVAMRPSKLAIFFCSFDTSPASQALSSGSLASLSAVVVVLAPVTPSLASLTSSSTSSTSLSKSGAVASAALALAGRTAAAFSALTTSSAASSMSFSADLTSSWISAFLAASSASFAKRSVRRTSSFSFSRSMPMETFKPWNCTFEIPACCPSSLKTLKILSVAA
mmetsp:Transcript_124857/g.266445  ORF Transcript_124857/g.266445 Transcript_124857/m.266445 type:complete len:430 (+) Transcript_124857:245-1534(+)